VSAAGIRGVDKLKGPKISVYAALTQCAVNTAVHRASRPKKDFPTKCSPSGKKNREGKKDNEQTGAGNSPAFMPRRSRKKRNAALQSRGYIRNKGTPTGLHAVTSASLRGGERGQVAKDKRKIRAGSTRGQALLARTCQKNTEKKEHDTRGLRWREDRQAHSLAPT